jgi:alkylation response protein AidB-like acyl-CoA dehydrogenase
MQTHEHTLDDALEVLKQHAERSDGVAVWPEHSWRAVHSAGVLSWSIAPRYGGAGWDGVKLLQGYEKLASACLTTSFILSQRDAACRRLHDSNNERVQRRILPGLTEGGGFITVGLSQLTTSRQHLKPSLAAKATGEGFVLDGTIPWVTGAMHAQFIVIGAVVDDGRQILAALPNDAKGVKIDPPLHLMALEGSLTAEIRCNNVKLDSSWLLAGPSEKVMGTGRGGTGGLETSCLALGLAGAAIQYLMGEAQNRQELRFSAERFEQVRHALREEMHALAERGYSPEQAAALRARANALVLRSTQSALTASKGSGFLREHPAQRWARQALFFLVWSCPRAAAEATLAYLSPDSGPACS